MDGRAFYGGAHGRYWEIPRHAAILFAFDNCDLRAPHHEQDPEPVRALLEQAVETALAGGVMWEDDGEPIESVAPRSSFGEDREIPF